MSINKKYETKFFPRVKKTLDRKFDETIETVKSKGIGAAISNLNDELTNPALVREVRLIHSTVGLRHAQLASRSLKRQERKGLGADAIEWVNWITDYLRQHLIEKVAYFVNATTRDRLLNILYESLKQGWGINETIKKITEDNFTRIQAARIVRTEVNIASNAGTLATGSTYEYETQKEWIAVEDFRTRGVDPEDHASHIGLNGTIIDFDEVFVDPRNGDRLMSPGDPKAEAESIINCRCQLGLIAKRDRNGRLIRKKSKMVV